MEVPRKTFASRDESYGIILCLIQTKRQGKRKTNCNMKKEERVLIFFPNKGQIFFFPLILLNQIKEKVLLFEFLSTIAS